MVTHSDVSTRARRRFPEPRFATRLVAGTIFTGLGLAIGAAGFVYFRPLVFILGGWFALSGVTGLADLLDDWQISRS